MATKQIHIRERVWKKLKESQRRLVYETQETWTYSRIIDCALDLYMKGRINENGDE